MQDTKNSHLRTIVQLCWAISSHVSTSGKNLLSSNISSRCLHNMVNFGLLAAEINPVANFNGFRILAALLNGTPVLGVSQTLRHWTEGATYIRQGGHHVGHWPTFLVMHLLQIKQKATENCQDCEHPLFLCRLLLTGNKSPVHGRYYCWQQPFYSTAPPWSN